MNRNIIRQISDIFFSLLFAIAIPMICFGTVIYLIQYVGSLVDLKEVPPPFELAIVSTALGGFLVSATHRRWSANIDHLVTTTSRLFLGSAISFASVYVLLFLIKSMTSPLNPVEWVAVVFTDILLIVASFTFAFGLVFLAYVILFWNRRNNS